MTLLSIILWSALIAFLIAQVSTFCTTIYLHRANTHEGLKLHPFIGFLMHLELALATGIKPREWAAVHRKHHRFSDQEGDPHSPYIEGLWRVLFLNVVMYKRETKNQDTIDTFTPNWKDDLIDRIPLIGDLGPAIGMLLLAVAFPFVFGLSWWAGGLLGIATWFLNAGMYIFLNAMINSVCHKVGYRNFEGQKATNLQWVALITAGEGLHNNHHEFPRSATMKARKWEIDPAWPVIRFLEMLGLAEYSESTLARVDSEKLRKAA
ncbi:MAG TPA: fatty acid desaturase [Bryobacterales bacterium]|nr:fatty acid desaturase [Bryobacterales bacterium]